MTSDLMKYKGYYGSYHLDSESGVLYGKLEFIKALVSYEATTAKRLQKAFIDAVDDYLEMCDQEHITPELPFKGSFNIRIGHSLHEKSALIAANQGMSLNQFICSAIISETHKYYDSHTASK